MKKICPALKILAMVAFGFLSTLKINGQNVDTLSLTKITQHFAFYSTQGDINVLDSLAETLENSYSRITNRLGVRIEKRINVKVYPDVKSFHVAINYPDAPDWVVGSSNDDELTMVSPSNPGSYHTYKSLMQVAVHEFVHIAVYYTSRGNGGNAIPRWLNEGYAQYEAGQINDGVRKYVRSSLSGKTPPTWAQLETSSAMEFGNMNGYGLSVMIVEFLVNNYGIDKLVLMIKEPENIEIIYGLSKDNLEKQWNKYLEALLKE